MAPQKQKQSQSRFSKFELILGSLTIFLSIFGTAVTISYMTGRQIQAVTQSIDSLKSQVAQTKTVLKQIANDNTVIKITSAQTKKDISNLDGRVTKIQTRTDRLQQKR